MYVSMCVRLYSSFNVYMFMCMYYFMELCKEFMDVYENMYLFVCILLGIYVCMNILRLILCLYYVHMYVYIYMYVRVCIYVGVYVCTYIRVYTGCRRKNVPDFGRVSITPTSKVDRLRR